MINSNPQEYAPGFKSPVTTLPDGTKCYSVLKDNVELGFDLIRVAGNVSELLGADLLGLDSPNVGGSQSDNHSEAAA